MTLPSVLDVVTLVCALGSGLIGGVFFAFSSFVMKALGHLPPAPGVLAMQSINVVVLNPWFLTPFVGTLGACGVAVLLSLLHWQGLRTAVIVAGGIAYVVGTFLVTMLCNVPRNDALAAVSAESPEAAALWVDYLSSWTQWNHVRALAALVAAAAFTLALWWREPG